MKDYICLKPGQKGLLDAGKEVFKATFISIGTFEGDQPVMRFNRDAYDFSRQAAKLRMKDYASTRRWDESADVTGLNSEQAVMKYLGLTPDEALSAFLEGLQGDRGYDLEIDGLKIDVKGTRGPGRWRFSKTNRHRDKANAYIFCKVEEAGAEVWVTITGYALRHEIKPWVREDSRSYYVRLETLQREGVLKPVSLLKPFQNITQTVTNPY